MNLPIPDQFHIKTLDELRGEARRIGLNVPTDDHVSVLAEPVMLAGMKIPNRLCVQPMEGCDASTDGAPGELTLRRYRRYAEGGFGLIWLEATAVDGQGRSSPRQLWINRQNVKAFAELVRDIKETGRHCWGHEVILILQLSHAGRYANSSDEYLDRLQETYRTAGCLAAEAGFDGVDVKACHGDLAAELLASWTRPGRYGGSFENRSRFLRETTAKLKAALSGCILASRITAYDGGRRPHGFGADRTDPRKVDLSEPVALVQALRDVGSQLFNISDGGPGSGTPDGAETPMLKFVRLEEITRAIQQAVPTIPVVGGNLSWFRHFLPNVAAGVVQQGGGALIGVGRAALAYPSLAGDLIRTGRLDPDKCCISCSACIQLIKDGGNAGCAIMDDEIYGAEYRRRHHFALDTLREEARRCLDCQPAPCRVGCPTRIDVPAFIKAFADDNVEKAYEIIRRTNLLPEMCAHLCPVGRMCEGRCVTNTLEGNPIPIHDIQYAVSWSARRSGLTGVHVPELQTGKRIAVVGSGPAGIACAAVLLEQGHQVVLFERGVRLGGTPEQIIRASRFTGAREEIEALLRPALREARLTLKFGCDMGRNLSLDDLRRDHDAVFLAAGVWRERSLGHPVGVLDALTFLRKARAGKMETVPQKVILLAGGDSAMDSAMVARELGARELVIVYEGALSEMHWHMPDSWFRTEGVHFMPRTRPMGYQVDADGRMTGLITRMNIGMTPAGTPGSEMVLEAGLIIEAMGLGLEESLLDALKGCLLSEEGLLKTIEGTSQVSGAPGVFAGGGMINGGAAVVQCVAEGMRAGHEIDSFLHNGTTL